MKKKEKGIRNEDGSAQADFFVSVWPASPLLVLSDAENVKSGGARNPAWPVGTYSMATKRTKADIAQRQSDQLEKKSERRPEQETSKRKVRKDFSRAA
jgi:ribosomal protein L9